MRPSANKRVLGLLIVGLFIVVLCTTGCTVPSTSTPSPTSVSTYVPKNNPGYLNYSNLTEKYTISYPRSWMVKELENATVFVATGCQTVYIAIDDATDLTLDEFVKSFVDTTPDAGWIRIGSGNTTLAGLSARMTSFQYSHSRSGTNSTELMKITVVQAVKNDRGYIIAYRDRQATFDENVELAENMIQSFNIIG